MGRIRWNQKFRDPKANKKENIDMIILEQGAYDRFICRHTDAMNRLKRARAVGARSKNHEKQVGLAVEQFVHSVTCAAREYLNEMRFPSDN